MLYASALSFLLRTVCDEPIDRNLLNNWEHLSRKAAAAEEDWGKGVLTDLAGWLAAGPGRGGFLGLEPGRMKQFYEASADLPKTRNPVLAKRMLGGVRI